MKITTNDCKRINAKCYVWYGKNYEWSKQQNEKPRLCPNSETIYDWKIENECVKRVCGRCYEYLGWLDRRRRCWQTNKRNDELINCEKTEKNSDRAGGEYGFRLIRKWIEGSVIIWKKHKMFCKLSF